MPACSARSENRIGEAGEGKGEAAEIEGDDGAGLCRQASIPVIRSSARSSPRAPLFSRAFISGFSPQPSMRGPFLQHQTPPLPELVRERGPGGEGEAKFARGGREIGRAHV